VAHALRVYGGTFRTLLDPLCGEIHLQGGVPRRKRARGVDRRVKTASRPSLAGPSDGSGFAEGGSATTSDARSSGRTTYAGPADGQADEPKRAPIPDDGGPVEPGNAEATEPVKTPVAMKELPGTLWGLVKAVNEEEQIIPVMGGLLRSPDERTRSRMVEFVVKIGYSDTAAREPERQSSFMQWDIRDQGGTEGER